MRRLGKWQSIISGVLLGLLLVLCLALYLFDWNAFRKPISSLVSEALDRPFVIKGNIAMRWSWTPTLTINDIELGNPDWAKQPEMATLNSVETTLNLPDLFKGHLVLPKVKLEKLKIFLQKNKEGKANWKVGNTTETDNESFNSRWFPRIEHLSINDDVVTFIDEKSDTELDMAISTVLGKSDEQNLKLAGRGKLQKEQFSLNFNGGSVLDLWRAEQPFPFDININYGKTKLKVFGTLPELTELNGINLNVEILGSDLAELSPFTGALLPVTRPYRFAGDIHRKNNTWLMKNFEGKLGNSDFNGNFSFTNQTNRPVLKGDVRAKKLDFRDFAGFIGANPNPGAPTRPKLFPSQNYNVEGFRQFDAEIKFNSDNIVTPYMPIDFVRAEIKLKQGLLEIKPFQASIESGKVVSTIMLDAKESKIKTRLEARIDKVPFKRLLKNTDFAKQTSGLFRGKIDLSTVGNSIADMAANSDGGITILMENGRISGLLMELAGLDILESLGIILNHDPALPMPCTIVDFIDTDGILKTKLFLMDTTDNKLTGEGQINLKNENLKLRITSKPKDVSLFSVNTPIVVTGTLRNPSPRPDPLSLSAKVAASVGLGIVGGPAAILPWVDWGPEENSPCQALLKAASRQDEIPLSGKNENKKSK